MLHPLVDLWASNH